VGTVDGLGRSWVGRARPRGRFVERRGLWDKPGQCYRNASGSVRPCDHAVETPRIGYTFELVLAAIFEHEPGPGDEILHGL
jgi:hypothetical protein